ncbi:DUF4342 domain-containing protein [Ammoniphilus resinae]|uniref:DUF4342 domain-containing protein n=1 Tax=Ammoniphilus resinae TaxID=861532 RepID=A0ABS4GJV3_9BACL|nr:DUF4342 domain-containing protein [Ammoniphilus resinae]MBP1930538.1 hypothetical protein [Ammoniphilus resinae]
METNHVHHQKNEDWIEELLPGEEDTSHTGYSTFYATGQEVWNLVREILGKANIVKITVFHGEKEMVSIPIVYGGVMAALFPFLSIFSMISLLALNCKVVVAKRTA